MSYLRSVIADVRSRPAPVTSMAGPVSPNANAGCGIQDGNSATSGVVAPSAGVDVTAPPLPETLQPAGPKTLVRESAGPVETPAEAPVNEDAPHDRYTVRAASPDDGETGLSIPAASQTVPSSPETDLVERPAIEADTGDAAPHGGAFRVETLEQARAPGRIEQAEVVRPSTGTGLPPASAAVGAETGGSVQQEAQEPARVAGGPGDVRVEPDAAMPAVSVDRPAGGPASQEVVRDLSPAQVHAHREVAVHRGSPVAAPGASGVPDSGVSQDDPDAGTEMGRSQDAPSAVAADPAPIAEPLVASAGPARVAGRPQAAMDTPPTAEPGSSSPSLKATVVSPATPARDRRDDPVIVASPSQQAPGVQIGQVDVFIEAPSTRAPKPASAVAADDAASRSYFRRL
jgi:hypothetical protein